MTRARYALTVLMLFVTKTQGRAYGNSQADVTRGVYGPGLWLLKVGMGAGDLTNIKTSDRAVARTSCWHAWRQSVQTLQWGG